MTILRPRVSDARPSGLRKIALAFAFSLPIAATSADSQSASLAGVVEAAHKHDVAFSIDGQISTIHFSEGQLVSEGDILAELDDREAQLRLALAQNTLAIAQAKLIESRNDLARHQKLKKLDRVAEAQLSDVKLTEITAELEADRARLEVEVQLARLAAHRFVSPASGMISAPFVNVGSNYTTYESGSIATISSLDPINVRALVPIEAAMKRIRMGQFSAEQVRNFAFGLTFVDGTAYPHTGRIAAIGFEMVSDTGEGNVIIRFPNPKLNLRPGMPVLVKVVTEGKLAGD